MNISNSNVVVCGGCGFLGSHLVDYLIEKKNCDVFVLDNLMVGRREWLNPRAKFIWCDITHSEKTMYQILKSFGIDFVFNYTAMPYIPESFERPLHCFDINTRGALMVMNACQDAGVKKMLQISSAEIYGDASGKIKETDPARPRSTYGASKLAIDYLVQARWKEQGTRAIALRQFNCVGEHETHPYVIPEIIRQVCNVIKQGTILLGNNSERDFLYAGDQARMATELLEKGECGEVYNLGSEKVIKIYELAEMIAQIIGKKITITEDSSRMRPWEIWHLQSDNSKIYSVIESRPEVNLRYALELTIADYIKHGWCW